MGNRLVRWLSATLVRGRPPTYGIPVGGITGLTGWVGAMIKPIVDRQLLPSMTHFLALFALVLLVGLCVFLQAVHSAPEGKRAFMIPAPVGLSPSFMILHETLFSPMILGITALNFACSGHDGFTDLLSQS